MSNVKKVIFILSITINLILGFILTCKHCKIETDSNVYINKIDSLESELFTLQQLKDSIKSSIDTVFIQIENNQNNYEEVRDIILSNSVNDDYLFFTEYIDKRKQRYDSISNR